MKKPPFRALTLLWHRLTGSKTVTLAGVRLHTDAGRVPRSLQSAIFKGRYELPERVLATRALRKGDRVLEIGTGLGFISLLCSRLAGPGQVVSYEANPALAPIIAANYALNGLDPRLVLKAVTTDGAPVTFFQNDNVVSSSLLDRDLGARRITVESDPINSVIDAHRPDVIVMDVEGAEIALLTEAHLAGVRAMVVEVHPHIVGQAAIDALLAHLAAQGFGVAQTLHKNVLLTPGRRARPCGPRRSSTWPTTPRGWPMPQRSSTRRAFPSPGWMRSMARPCARRC
ncbi:FkbM family methyltransferase [Paracoccaceae bacterium Fryx2]|nr:FkbM family methyltransferase [Paracoccaceae bacterium Fryx2]